MGVGKKEEELLSGGIYLLSGVPEKSLDDFLDQKSNFLLVKVREGEYHLINAPARLSPNSDINYFNQCQTSL